MPCIDALLLVDLRGVLGRPLAMISCTVGIFSKTDGSCWDGSPCFVPSPQRFLSSTEKIISFSMARSCGELSGSICKTFGGADVKSGGEG